MSWEGGLVGRRRVHCAAIAVVLSTPALTFLAAFTRFVCRRLGLPLEGAIYVTSYRESRTAFSLLPLRSSDWSENRYQQRGEGRRNAFQGSLGNVDRPSIKPNDVSGCVVITYVINSSVHVRVSQMSLGRRKRHCIQGASPPKARLRLPWVYVHGLNAAVILHAG